MNEQEILYKISKDEIRQAISKMPTKDQPKYKNLPENDSLKRILNNRNTKNSFLIFLLSSRGIDYDAVKRYNDISNSFEYSNEVKVLLVLFLFSINVKEKTLNKNLFINSDFYKDVMKISTTEDIIEDNTQLQTEEIVERDIESENNMAVDGTYIGIIKNENSDFYNVYPRYFSNNRNIEKLTEYKEWFPPYGKIKLAGMDGILSKNDFLFEKYVVFTIKQHKLQKNSKPEQAEFQINKDNINFLNLNSIGIYRVVEHRSELSESEKDYQLFIENKQYFYNHSSTNNEFENEKVIVKYEINDETIYLQPSEVDWRQADNKYYIKTDIKTTKLVKSYSQESIDMATITEFDYYFDNQRNDNIYVDINKIENKSNFIDFRNPKEILNKLIKDVASDSIKDGYVSVDKIIEIINDDSNFTEEYIAPKELENIKNKLTDYVYSAEDNSELLNQLIDIICELIIQSENDKTNNENLDKLIEHISQQAEILEKIQSYSMVKEKIKELKSEQTELNDKIKDLHIDIDQLQKDKNKYSQEYKKEAEINVKKELLELKEELETVSADLDQLKKIYNEYKTLDDVVKKRKDLQGALRVQEDDKTELTQTIKNLEYEYNEKYKKEEANLNTKLKDDFIKKRNDEIAQSVTKDESEQKYHQSVEIINKVSSDLEGIDFGDYTINQMLKVRTDYNKDDCINIFASIYTGFLTVFSGRPGTGKTSICNIVAEILGLTQFGKYEDINLNRFVSISVERGWTSKRDFLGYYNPLTKQFDKNNKHLFDCLNIQNYELEKLNNDNKESNNKIKNTKYPVLVLLDEANLSSMEYYWGDFNKMADKSLSNELNMGNDLVLNIPENLKFLATINNDHTTEMLSPRIIDRAWIINLPSTDNFSETDYQLLTDKIITWETICNYFEGNQVNEISKTVDKYLQQIYTMVNEIDMYISARSKILIEKYIKITTNIYGDDNLKCLDYVVSQKILPMINGNGEKYIKITTNIYGDDNLKCLDYVVAQKVLPMINGNGENYSEVLEELLKLFTDSNVRLDKSKSIIEKIIKDGKNNMHYYNYFS